MKSILGIVAFSLVMAVTSAPALADKYRDRSAPISVAENFDLKRYLGLWYEIARFPNRFEKGCVGVTAEYRMRDDGKVAVINSCKKGSLSAEAETIEGTATVQGPAKLRVNFVSWLPFAAGDYWVLYVDAGYQFAVVGEPKGNTGWILARNKSISNAQLNKGLEVLAANGYDTAQMVRVQQ